MAVKVSGGASAGAERLAGWQGLSLLANIFQIHNTGRIRRDLVGGVNTIAAIEAVPATRLSELWLEQKFAGGMASVRAGQLAADGEFFYSATSTLFLQSDWPTIAALNLPSGGAAYPLSTPGARLKVDPNQHMTLQFEVLNGDPAGPGPGDEQVRNRHGLNFRVQDPPFFIGEVQFRYNQAKEDTGLAGTVKLGAWGHVGQFDDQRFAADGTLLANPIGSGVPIRHRGNSGIYAVIDQQIYRPKGGSAEDGIILYSRMSLGPSDRNPISAYIDSGIVFAGMVPHRPDDKFGAGFIYAKYSDSLRAFDRDQIAFSGVPGVVRDYEANLELTYQAHIVPGWTVQPVVTRIWHPSGDASLNAWVAGVRSMWRY